MLVVLCWVGTVMVQGEAVERKESGRVMAKLEQFCQDKCQRRLAPAPGDPACTHFCGFVTHIRIAHEAALYSLFRDGQRNIQPLVRSNCFLFCILLTFCFGQLWAMNDVIQEKLQAKLDDEDDHTVGELFFEKAKGWYAYLHQRDEL